MNFNHIASSWIGLGTIIFVIHQLVLSVCDSSNITYVPLLALVISSLVGSYVFTYYLCPYLLTPSFKIKALCIPITLGIISFLHNCIACIHEQLGVFAFLFKFIANTFIVGAIGISFTITIMVISMAARYPLITLANRQALNALKK